MRPHVIVFAVVIAAAVLILVLARQGSGIAPVAALTDPVIAVEHGTRTSAVDIASDVPSASVTTVAAPASAPVEARKAAERITTCTLGGYVLVEGEERVPVSRAYVGLFRPAVGAEPDKVAFGQWTGPAEIRPAQHQLLTWTYSDDDGKFEFDELKAGTYFVRVELGPLIVRVDEPQTLEPGEVRAGLLIRLPISGGLNGTILAPPGVDFDVWQVGMQRKDPLDAPMYVDGLPVDLLKAAVEADGTFHLAPGEAGLHTVWLAGRTELNVRRIPVKFLIGEVKIVAGQDAEQVFDLREGFPGSLRVTLRVPALEGTRFAKMSHQLLAHPWSGGRGVPNVTAFCAAGATTTLGPLAPGTWALSVQCGFAPWIYDVEIPESVSAGQTNDFTIEVPLYSGALTCIDSATGKPISGPRVMIRPLVRHSGFAMCVSADENGVASLMLVKGSYAVYVFEGFDDGLEETIEWREDGPHPSSVKLLAPVTAPR